MTALGPPQGGSDGPADHDDVALSRRERRAFDEIERSIDVERSKGTARRPARTVGPFRCRPPSVVDRTDDVLRRRLVWSSGAVAFGGPLAVGAGPWLGVPVAFVGCVVLLVGVLALVAALREVLSGPS